MVFEDTRYVFTDEALEYERLDWALDFIVPDILVVLNVVIA
jgi:hypothetical protein